MHKPLRMPAKRWLPAVCPCFASAALVFCFCARADAQTLGNVSGTVTDTAGHPAPRRRDNDRCGVGPIVHRRAGGLSSGRRALRRANADRATARICVGPDERRRRVGWGGNGFDSAQAHRGPAATDRHPSHANELHGTVGGLLRAAGEKDGRSIHHARSDRSRAATNARAIAATCSRRHGDSRTWWNHRNQAARPHVLAAGVDRWNADAIGRS